ncbi:hypothetical protein [Pradoshia sp.]
MKKFFILFILMSILGGCSSLHLSSSVKFESPVYSGEELHIGIVGDKPVIREKNITFVELSMEDIENGEFTALDSVFINEPYLEEAAQPQYADVYLQSPIPFVFINSERVILAFVEEELSYEGAHTIKSGDYLIGWVDDTNFGLNLYDNEENEKTIQDCFSRMFMSVENYKQTGQIL